MLSVLPVAFWPGSTSYEVAKFLVIALAIAGLFGTAAWKIWRRQPLVLPPRKFFGGALAVVLLILGSGLAGGGLWLSLRTAVLVSAAIIVSSIAFLSVRTESHLKNLLRAIVAGGCLTSLYGLAQLKGLLPGPDPALGVPQIGRAHV